MPEPSRPLEGLHILDLTRLPPGAYCTVLLADLGADVCCVESPNSARLGSSVGLARGKRSVGVDLRNPRGAEVLRRLARWADVLVENERPGAMDDRGFGYSHASTEMPTLIWCSISGFGQDGPYAQWSGHDVSFTAHSGLLSAINPALPWHPQTVLSIPIGALMAVVGILGALRERDRTGKGSQLDISLSESASWLLSAEDGEINGTPRGVPVGPDRHLYECADGGWIVVAAAEPRTWSALCEELGLDDLTDALHRWDDRDAVIDRLAAIFRTKPAAEWVAQLGPRAAVARANRGAELREDPHVEARQSLRNVGDVLVPRSPIRVRDGEGPLPPADTFPPRAVGSDTRAILGEAGFSTPEIDELLDGGAIAEA
jgi:alpha-methylacyl-CoA racemase